MGSAVSTGCNPLQMKMALLKKKEKTGKKFDTLFTTFEKYNLQGHRSNALYILQHRTQITDPGSVAYIDSNVSLWPVKGRLSSLWTNDCMHTLINVYYFSGLRHNLYFVKTNSKKTK